ncbi:unnamed protein product [Brassica oleracea var. botrytis]
MEKLYGSIKRIWYKLFSTLIVLCTIQVLISSCLIISLTICFFVEGSSRRRFHSLRWEKNLLEDQRRDQELFRSK